MKSIIIIYAIATLQVLASSCSSIKNNVVRFPTSTLKQDTVIRFGLIADIQYCDCDTQGSRYYRNALPKLDSCVEDLNGSKIQFSVNLGDLVDRDSPKNMDSVLVRLRKLDSTVYNLTGNHDYGNVNDNNLLYTMLNMPHEYYSFRRGKWLFILINTNEIASYANVKGTAKEKELSEILQKIKDSGRPNGASYNGGISQKQMLWLDQQLKAAERESLNTLIFSHHPLYGIEGLTALNDLEIIETISKYTTVKAVISGHHHAGAFGVYKGISFITTEGMVETESTNAYGIVTVSPSKITLEGKGRTKSHVVLLSPN